MLHEKGYRFRPMGDRGDLAAESTSRNLWTRGRARKPTKCRICKRPIERGELQFRPVTEGGNTVRNERICPECVGARFDS